MSCHLFFQVSRCISIMLPVTMEVYDVKGCSFFVVTGYRHLESFGYSSPCEVVPSNSILLFCYSDVSVGEV